MGVNCVVNYSKFQILTPGSIFWKSIYSKRQIKRNDGSIQANCATKEILIPNWVISIPISIMFINFIMLIFYSSKKPPKLWIFEKILSEWKTKF